MKLRAAIIVDQLKASKWMIDALNETSDQLEIIYVLNCVSFISAITLNIFIFVLYDKNPI